MPPPPPSAMRPPAALVDHAALPVRLLVTDCPSDATLLDDYLPLLRSHRVSVLVRLCDPTAYNPAPLLAVGVRVVDSLSFEDGTVPPDAVVSGFRDLLDEVSAATAAAAATAAGDATGDDPRATVALHCVSGIGRAPVLAVVALVDAGLDALDAVELVRSVRRGALNRRQLEWATGRAPGGGLRPRKARAWRPKWGAVGGGGGGSSRASTASTATATSAASTSTPQKPSLLGLFKKR
ncbi:Protein tyrosine phosphatase prl-1 [Cladochytrium tenue]|nr:Protein tyrosine phosphatase prl-1 [Cladochytrium tenue]